MKKVPAAFLRLFHPPKWVMLSAPPAVFAALIWFLRSGQSGSALAKRAKAVTLHRITSTAFGRSYVQDLSFRGTVSICKGMVLNFLYVVFRMAVGIRYRSVWFLSMAVYYLALGILRLSLILRARRKDRTQELRCYRRTAWLLFLLNLPMGGMILLMVLTDAGYSYPGYVIYLSAIYTFYTMTMSIVNLVKYRRLGSPILSAAKALNFIAALMSVLGLQTAMITAFSAHGAQFRQVMNAVTGGCIWTAVILTAICMLHRSRPATKEEMPVELL